MRRTAVIVVIVLFLACGSAYGQQGSPPTQLWEAFPLREQVGPQPLRQQPAGRSAQRPQLQPRGDHGQTPLLWILVGTIVGLGATAAVVASSLSKSRRGGDMPSFRLIRSGESMWLALVVAGGLAVGWLVSHAP